MAKSLPRLVHSTAMSAQHPFRPWLFCGLRWYGSVRQHRVGRDVCKEDLLVDSGMPSVINWAKTCLALVAIFYCYLALYLASSTLAFFSSSYCFAAWSRLSFRYGPMAW